MKDPCVIPTNFKVPRGLQHEWALFHEREMISVIAGVPTRKELHHWMRPPSGDYDEAAARSQMLDWIAESVEHLRHLCGADE